MNERDGLILVDKEKGMTSREVTNYISKLFGVKKSGHLGTLDPFAEGLLPIFIGRGTKMIPYVNDEMKSYSSVMRLGETTPTLDTDSEVSLTKEVPLLSEEKIKEVFLGFIGTYKQKIPLTSAKRVNGKHLYEYAHKGIEIEEQYKEASIYSLELVSYSDNEICFNVTVSKGTYIRTLAYDIAVKLGTISYLTSLKRTKIGEFEVGFSKKIKDITASDIIPIKDIPSEYKGVEIGAELYKSALNGNPFSKNQIKTNYDKIMLIYTTNPIALYKLKGDMYICERGLL
ncbi:MAG: tRNA pseudouridine(55) synthase TruB [Coprobacillus sp.]|nr:tRNA pseudouridine(55) synthase TruB [Coprobacillus sp.]